MARLHFLHTPLDRVDFDVCAGPPRPETAPPPAKPAGAAEEKTPDRPRGDARPCGVLSPADG